MPPIIHVIAAMQCKKKPRAVTGRYMSVPQTLTRKYPSCLHALGTLVGLELHFLSLG